MRLEHRTNHTRSPVCENLIKPPKPKGMHCRTYSRLRLKARSAEMVGMEAMLAQVERMTARVATGTLQRKAWIRRK
jgi:hypothetical protein